jgi:hypothetical protein
VAAHVAERAGAEIEPAAPGERVIDFFDEGPLGGDAEPEVPIEVFRHG